MSTKKEHRHPTKKKLDFRQLNYPAEIRIKSPDRLDEIQVLATDLANLLDWFKNYYKKEVPEKDKEYLHLLNLIGEICIGLWRAKSKMVDSDSGEPLEETRRALRPIDSTLDLLRQSGFEIKDRTNTPYVIGMLEKVITWENKEGLTSEVIIETIKPTIVYQEKIIKQGEIIVGVPPKA